MHPLYPHTWCQLGSSPPPNVYPKQQNHCLNIQKSKPALESAKSRGESKLKSLLSTESTLSPVSTHPYSTTYSIKRRKRDYLHSGVMGELLLICEGDICCVQTPDYLPKSI